MATRVTLPTRDQLVKWLAMTAPFTMSGMFALMLLEIEASNARILALLGPRHDA